MLTAWRLATIGDDTDSIDSSIALALLANGRFGEVVSQARLAAAEFSKESGRTGEAPWLSLIAAEYLSGNAAGAKARLQSFLGTPRTFSTLASIRRLPTLTGNANLLDGLRGAGMPEQ